MRRGWRRDASFVERRSKWEKASAAVHAGRAGDEFSGVLSECVGLASGEERGWTSEKVGRRRKSREGTRLGRASRNSSELRATKSVCEAFFLLYIDAGTAQLRG